MDLNACILQHFGEAERKVEMTASTDTAERQVWMTALKAMAREIIEGCARIVEGGGNAVEIRALEGQIE